jgi:6-pyruvoyl-tetrahydropterin synthase
MTILFVNRLTVIDSSFLCAVRGLVGESWQVDVELEGALDYQGMVLDFGDVKPLIKRHIDHEFDHKLLVPADHPALALHETPEGAHLDFRLDDGREIAHRSPADALTLLPTDHISAAGLAQIIADSLRTKLPENVSDLRLRLWTEVIDGAHYHYSHGLKHHAGNCQRIAHGHRSRIEIWRNGLRDRVLEQDWADRWQDVYIGTSEDVIGTSLREGLAYYEFGYTGSQGEFGLTLPQAASYLIDSDSTVENIAQHIAEQLKADFPADEFRVYAYEGVDKGAVGIA